MEGIKVRVRYKNEADSVISLLEKNGFLKPYSNFILHDGWVCFNEDMQILCVCNSQAGKELDDYAEIRINEIKDKVILNRNDSNDANVYQDGDIPCLYDLYLTKDKELYFYHCGKNKWILSNLNHDEDYYKLLKPIEKEVVMKEFLNPLVTGGYELSDTLLSHDSIEIPEGAEIACDWCNDCDFYKLDGDLIYTFEYGNWELCEFNKEQFFQNVRNILWKREEVEVESEKLDTDAMLADIDVQIATHSQHGHYFKDVRNLNVIDVYQVLMLFNVTDPCLQHIIKKALVAGGRGHKDFERDLRDIHDTSKRALEINNILH